MDLFWTTKYKAHIKFALSLVLRMQVVKQEACIYYVVSAVLLLLLVLLHGTRIQIAYTKGYAKKK